MRYTYDPDADALYIYIQEGGEVARSVVIDEDRSVDLDSSDRCVGIELVGASEGVHVVDLVAKFGLGEFESDLQNLEGFQFRRSPKIEYA